MSERRISIKLQGSADISKIQEVLKRFDQQIQTSGDRVKGFGRLVS